MKKIWNTVRDLVLAWAKKLAQSWLMKRLFGGVLGGIWGWIATWVFDWAWGKYIKPVFLWIFRKIKSHTIDKYRTRKATKKVRDAKTEAEFDDAFSDLP